MEVARDHAFRFAHPYYADALPLDAARARRLPEHYPIAHLRDVTAAIDRMHNIKRPTEIAVLRRNGKLSAGGVRDVFAHAYPGMYQYELEALAAYDFMKSRSPRGCISRHCELG